MLSGGRVQPLHYVMLHMVGKIVILALRREAVVKFEPKWCYVDYGQPLVEKYAISSLHWSFCAFHVVFVPLEYVPTIPLHSTYVIVFLCWRTSF